MRTILFKAKKLSDGKWVKGSLVKTPFGTFIEWYEDSVCNKEEVDPDTVCQFIGLVDTNGVEVYENDIVKSVDWEETICNVEYKDYGFCLCGKHFRGGMMPLGVTVGNCYIYVVGNKFDKEE
jgi:hypothetical protein